ncbi:MAG: zinc ribbon domain-containing protein, partial [Anaerolineae bacterium]|nr:zinc ribbon domain-containing protein [Anaerolineae bacterium]
MSEAFKICPICETANHRNASFCVNCGASLGGVNIISSSSTTENSPIALYDYRYGETDLYEGSLRRIAQRYLFAIILTLSLLMLGGAALIFAPRLNGGVGGSPGSTTEGRILFQTNIPRPTLDFPTVTVGEPTRTASRTQPPQPTATLTPTREPCLQEVLPDDGLISMVTRCGHRDLFVITEVIELNDLVDAGDIRPGEILEIPWPTETIDPNITPTLEPTQVAAISAVTAEAVDVTTGDSAQIRVDLTQLADPFFIPTSTLPPGV